MNLKNLLLSSVGCLFMISGLNAQTTLGLDDYDGAEMFISREFTPDLSGQAIPGTFPGSRFDVFGIVDRFVNFDFSDDTLMSPGFTGMFPTTVTDRFVGTEDLENGDNVEGTASLVYQIDISGGSNLVFSADFACWGDFEISNDINTITASIDGGPEQLLIELIAAEDDVQIYTYEGIDPKTNMPVVEEFDDPMSIQGVLLSNFFQTFSAPINGSGSTLTLTFSFQGNGGSECLAIDNMMVVANDKSKVIPGDVNCDGIVSLLDVAPFVDALNDPAYNIKADVDQNGTDDLLDIRPFVDLLTDQ